MVDKNLARLHRLHYFRGTRSLSPRASNTTSLRRTSLALAFGVIASTALAQYPGQIEKKSKDAPMLRAIAVLEWTGDLAKPKKSRLVPVTVYDGQALHDGSIYLARPQPLALTSEVEYELQKDGSPLGLFDIKKAGQEQGMWVGYGSWKPMPSAKLESPKPVVDTGFDANDDKPVLHRKHSDSAGKSDSGPPAPAPDDDRPKLHKPTGDDASADASPAPDPDRPTIHKEKPPVDSTSPVLHKHDDPNTDDGEHSSFTDPDRPRLMRGRPTGGGADVLPTLLGFPPDMQQAVAVSDAKSRPEHSWDYTWANPDDEGKMKAALEDIARDALGLKTPPPPAPKRASTRKPIKRVPPPEPPALEDEKFRVFELAYGSGATMVLSAHTGGSPREQKFVTLIAQPDLYGSPLVLLKSVTDGAHLDETQQMRLVDAVDAMADNRGELLFELRGASQRQFALYRVLRGTAEKIFTTGGGEFGSAAGD